MFSKKMLFKVPIMTIFIICFSVLISHQAKGVEYPQKGVVAKTAMVATPTKATTKIVLDLLKKGWNAVDAAIATQFLMGVRVPGATGIGGKSVSVTIYWAKTGEFTQLEAIAIAPERASATMFEIEPGLEPGLPGKVKDRANVIGYKAICVPAPVKGLYEAHKKYGTQSWESLIEPAIRLAEEGFVATEPYVEALKTAEKNLRMFPGSAALYLPGGKIPEIGQRIFNKDLAKTLRKIADQGPDVFYKGEIADSIVSYLQKNGGIITKKDFLAPKLGEGKLFSFTYGGYRFFVKPNEGGSTLAEILNILSNFDLRRMVYQTPESLHIIIEAMKLAFTDRYAYAGDPGTAITPLDGMVSWIYGWDQAKRIDLQKAQIFNPGDPWPYQNVGKNLSKSLTTEKIKSVMGSGDHTTQYDIVDQYGNIVITSTSNRSGFGSGVVVPGTGFVLNDQMGLFDPAPGNPNSIAPFKIPLANGCQVIVTKNNKPFLALGAPGGRRIITSELQVLINMINYGMSLQDAIDAPRVHCEAIGKEVCVESRIPEVVRKELEKKGHKIKLFKDYDEFFALVQAVQIDTESGLLFGGSDPRTDGAAMGF